MSACALGCSGCFVARQRGKDMVLTKEGSRIMAGDLQRDGVKFCRSIFDTVRKMSADGLGVTRQGYSTTETEVLDYLKMIGQELGLEINTDLAGNVWMCLPGKTAICPPSLRAVMPTAFRRGAITTDWRVSPLLWPWLGGCAARGLCPNATT